MSVPARVPSVPLDDPDPAVQRVFGTFAAEGREPIALYRALGNAPWLLEAYSGLARALRYEATLPRALRELVILRGAQLNRSDYEWSHHRALAAKAGVPEEQARAVGAWRTSGLFGPRERAALAAVERLNAFELDDAAFAELREHFEQHEIVELLFVCGFYELVARLIHGLGIEVEEAYRPYVEPFPEPGPADGGTGPA